MSPLPSVFEIAERNTSLRFFLAAIKAAGLVTVLRQSRPITLFAPTDEACTRIALDAFVAAHVRGARSRARLLVSNHVVRRLVHFEELLRLDRLETSLGEYIPVAVTEGVVTLQHAALREADLRARNGILHIIDAVLIPSSRSGRPTPLGSST